MKTKMMLLMILAIVVSTCRQDQPYPYLNTDLTVKERVTDLVSRMTLDEKISQMMNSAAAIDSLDIPAYNWWNECLHGVARAGVATVFPQAIGLAATWNPNLMHKVADVISTEARAKYNDFISKGDHGIYKGLTFWSPNINIFRDPRWGRGQETYGEDPWLTARMGVAFVEGLQGDDPNYFKVVATPKHFAVHSGPEPDRHHFDVDVSDTDLWNTYLPAFEATIMEAGAFSVMGAYNRFRGQSCSASTFLLDDILRKRWNFKGYVVSDCGAIHDIFSGHHIVDSPAEAAALGVKAGCDLNCGRTYEYLKEAVEDGLISEALIDTSVYRLFTARFKLGMFDPTDKVPWSDLTLADNDTPEHRKLALQVARESLVLLKNEQNLLPLNLDRIDHIAVIGPNADNLDVLLGNYNGTPTSPVTLLKGIQQSVPEDVTVSYAPGCDLVAEYGVLTSIPAQYLHNGQENGLQGRYFDNKTLSGEPVLERTDTMISFEFGEGKMPEQVPVENFSVQWTGTLIPPENGEYVLGLTGDDGYRLFIDNKKVIDLWSLHGPVTTRKKITLQAGHPYQLKLDYFQNQGGAMVDLAWMLPGRDARADAIHLAENSDIVIFAGGISPRLEGEEMKVPYAGFSGGDRTSLNLPEIQENLLKDLYATGKPVIFVDFSGSAMALSWESKTLPVIIQAFYPGQSAGTAIADIIFGRYNPSGRLPVTFYVTVDDLPPFTDYDMQGRTYRYFTGKVLYPFGYGLSYNHYNYDNIAATNDTLNDHETIEISVDVTNTGDYTGDEVVQLYIGFPASPKPRPVKTLRGIKRIGLSPGEKKKVTFNVDKALLYFMDPDGRKVTSPGTYSVMIGKNANDVLTYKINVK